MGQKRRSNVKQGAARAPHTTGIAWRECNAFFLRIMPWDRVLCFRERRPKVASQLGASHHASWPGGHPQAISLHAACAFIATIPCREVSGPITTILLPTMIHPSLAVADESVRVRF